MTLPQKNGSGIKTPLSKSSILVSFCWRKNVLLINALTNQIQSLISLKLVIKSVAFFLGHPVYRVQGPVSYTGNLFQNQRPFDRLFAVGALHFGPLGKKATIGQTCQLTHQNIYSQSNRKYTSTVSSSWQQKFLYFHYKSVKTWMFCVDKIKYEHLAILSNLKSCQFAPRIVIFNLWICCQFEDLKIISPKIIPMSHRNI